MRFLGALGITICLFYLGQFAFDSFRTRGAIYSHQNSEWRVQVLGKTLSDVTLPLRLDGFTNKRSGAQATLTKRIEIPKQCFRQPCYLFLGEVGDLARVYLNNRLLRSQGYADGTKSLAKHYPLWVEIPENERSPIDLKLEIESLYGTGFGLTKGPLFIGDYAAVRSTERAMTLQTVTFPLMQALLLTILGILALTIWSLIRLNGAVFSYGVFALTEAAFMVSFSFLPREYLAVTAASALHYTLRLFSDWALFEVFNSVLKFEKTTRIAVRLLFTTFLACIGVLYLQGADYPAFVFLVKVEGLLILGTPLISLIVSFKKLLGDRELPVSGGFSLPMLTTTLVVLTSLQLWDVLLFWGVVTGPYLVKFYLAPLAMMLAIILFKRHVAAYESLKQSKSEAEKDAVLGRVAVELSHDLKSPLGALRDGAVIALSEQNQSDYTKKVLTEVIAKTELVSNRIQDLCNFARTQVQAKVPNDLRQVIDDVHLELKTQIEAKKINLVKDISVGSVFVDGESFKRAIFNLIDNAIYASKPNDRIEVKAKVKDGRLVFSVQDYGHGIDENNLPFIFEPYFTKNKPGGSGLGLAIVDRISRQHRGHVHAYSKPNLGSTFIMEIPQ